MPSLLKKPSHLFISSQPFPQHPSGPPCQGTTFPPAAPGRQAPPKGLHRGRAPTPLPADPQTRLAGRLVPTAGEERGPVAGSPRARPPRVPSPGCGAARPARGGSPACRGSWAGTCPPTGSWRLKSARRPPQPGRARSPGPRQRREERPVRRPPRDTLRSGRRRRERNRAAAPPRPCSPSEPRRLRLRLAHPDQALAGLAPPCPLGAPLASGLGFFSRPKRQFSPPCPGGLCVCSCKARAPAPAGRSDRRAAGEPGHGAGDAPSRACHRRGGPPQPAHGSGSLAVCGKRSHFY